MVQLTRLESGDATFDDVVSVIDRDGGVIIENFLSPDLLAGLRADLMPLIAKQHTGKDEFFGMQTRRLSALFGKSLHCADVVTHPHFLPVARHFICKPAMRWSGTEKFESNCDVQVSASQVIQIGPGQGGQTLHRDDGAFFWSRSYGREARLQIMIALTEFTAANGGTMVIPGSHRWDDERWPDPELAVPTEMPPGAALLFLGGTYHGGGTNRTEDEWRAGLTFCLDASFIRQEENQYLSLSPEEVARYPEEVQRLLGWSMSGRSLGWVEVDGVQIDPNQLLPGKERTA